MTSKKHVTVLAIYTAKQSLAML